MRRHMRQGWRDQDEARACEMPPDVVDMVLENLRSPEMQADLLARRSEAEEILRDPNAGRARHETARASVASVDALLEINTQTVED